MLDRFSFMQIYILFMGLLLIKVVIKVATKKKIIRWILIGGSFSFQLELST